MTIVVRRQTLEPGTMVLADGRLVKSGSRYSAVVPVAPIRHPVPSREGSKGSMFDGDLLPGMCRTTDIVGIGLLEGRNILLRRDAEHPGIFTAEL